eukprot:9128717-Alexandrium_andersonii.AAC.1
MLTCMLAARARAPARRPAGVEAPRKVRVNVRANGCALILPREVVDTPRALDEVPGEAHERNPTSA